jgi:hypothetical protein
VSRQGGFKDFKSMVNRPGNREFLQDVQIEFSNSSSSDWKVEANVV